MKLFYPCFFFFFFYKSRISVFTPGHLSPTHSCLEDGSHVTGHCPVAPISQAQSKGTPPKLAGEGGNPQSPHRPLLCDVEGNRRERPEYGNTTGDSERAELIPTHVSGVNVTPLWFQKCMRHFLLHYSPLPALSPLCSPHPVGVPSCRFTGFLHTFLSSQAPSVRSGPTLSLAVS